MPDAVGDIRLIRNKRKLEANTTQQYPLSVLYWITQLSSSSNLKIFNQNIKFPEIIQVFGNGRSILALNKSPDWHKKQQEKIYWYFRGYVLNSNYETIPIKWRSNNSDHMLQKFEFSLFRPVFNRLESSNRGKHPCYSQKYSCLAHHMQANAIDNIWYPNLHRCKKVYWIE